MRRLVLIGIVVAALFGAAADAVPVRRVDAGHGLSVVLPHGWRLSHARVSSCSDPLQRFVAVAGDVNPRPAMSVPAGSAVVLVQESWHGHFPARPGSFALPRLGNVGGCCEIPEGQGAELIFRDEGRRFYAFVYVHSPEQRRDAISLLNGLKVATTPEAGAGA